MFNIGMPEVVLVFIVALLVFGPQRLPEIGRQIGRAVLAFKRATRDVRDALEKQALEDISEEDAEKLGKSEEEKAQSV